MRPPNKIVIIAGLLLLAGIAFDAGGSNSQTSKYAQYMINAIEKALGKLTELQKNSIVAIVAAWARFGDGDTRKLAYILALSWHESRLSPIKEKKALPGTVVWDQYQVKYWDSGFYGRGFVQLTWQENYEKMSSVVGVDLVKYPDKALEIDIAAQIIVYGMMNGSFTGRKLSDYINTKQADYYNARRTVGAIMVAGKDTAEMIRGHLKKISANMA